MTEHFFMARQPETDITKHLDSLKTRLGFARFKLRNGWEKNTLLDVESFWKERQRQMVDSLPIPRFTQRDILDNRTLHPHYHYHKNGLLSSPTFTQRQHQRRHSHHSQERKKRKAGRLTRSHSTPTTSDSFTHSSQQHHQDDELSSTYSFSSDTQSPSAHDDDKSKPQSSDEYEADELDSDEGDDTEDDDGHYTHLVRKRARTITPPSPPITIDDRTQQKKAAIVIQPRRNKSSLDYLSYAISMTENQPTSNNHREMISLKDGEFHGALANPFIAPPSPVTAAAEAMMMFGHHSQ
ncbi:hypothetical protein BCR42DRAFT_417491 [Absidia repens]|uniref:Uncharacterized protein n=1 Tax=Absidia repens TaxID=90262 RepID=A0A1X2IE15_9FUNG|nr:hypothetical protein BCR42DRAFT_417491 [Absidia repens]